jgi:hypothetical protein
MMWNNFSRPTVLTIVAVAVCVFTVIFPGVGRFAGLAQTEPSSSPPAIAPDRLTEERSVFDVWRQVYEAIPDLPLENQYLSLETGQPAVNNTLASRLIRYHTFVKGRPANYRLDWKLTLADYLGVNERIIPGTYPGSDTLRTNPLEGDRTIIQRLSRAQRERLVQVLVSIFSQSNSTSDSTSPTSGSQPTQSMPAASPSSAPTSVQPEPGDARLLLP